MRRYFGPLTLAAVAGVALYAPVIARLVRQWVDDPDNSHGVLLLAAAAIVLRRRWPALRRLQGDGRDSGVALLIVAMTVYAAGTLGADLFLPRVSLPLALAGCVLAIGGASYLRLLAAPLVLLLLAIPLPGVLMTYMTMPMQLASSQVAAGLLEASHIQVERQGNLLALPNITLEVAEACSGLRSLVSLVSVAGVCAAVLSLSAHRTMLLLAAAVPIAIAGNGVRVAFAGVLTQWIGEAAVKGVVHDLTGYAAFIGMCGAILGVHVATRRRWTSTALRERPR